MKEKKHISIISIFFACVFWIMTFWLGIKILISQVAVDILNINKSVGYDGVMNIFYNILVYVFLTFFVFGASFFTNRISYDTSYSNQKNKFIKSENEFLIVVSFWFVMVIALFDEYLQIFLVGKVGNVLNVFFDLIGPVVVLALIRIFFLIILRIRGTKEERY